MALLALSKELQAKLGWQLERSADVGRFRIRKQVIESPPALLIRVLLPLLPIKESFQGCNRMHIQGMVPALLFLLDHTDLLQTCSLSVFDLPQQSIPPMEIWN